MRISPPKDFVAKAHIKSFEEYKKMYDRSIKDPDGFWGEMATKELHWFKNPPAKVFNWMEKAPAWKFEWFKGGKLNVSYNCLDRHVKAGNGDNIAITWEPDDPKNPVKKLTYKQMLDEVCKFANVLKKYGVKKGDRVCIYLPMITELPITMLACARIGAIHNVVFGGFSPTSLKERIEDSQCKIVVTANGGWRGAKPVPLKVNVDAAIQGVKCVEHVIMVNHTDLKANVVAGRDISWADEMATAANTCECEQMDAEDPLFILYTSGSTGRPKGVLHTTGGYLLFVTMTTKLIFDLKPEDNFWCTADIGWVTGHSYIVYGPLSNGFKSIMFEGVPTYPGPDRFWATIEKHNVNVFYTAPTAIRALMREGNQWPAKYPMKSLRLMGTVGEPINPDVWLWYHEHIGKKNCPIVDTWWQTETGGILIVTLPGAMDMKPGSAGFPFFGLETKVLSPEGKEVKTGESGGLVITRPWPALLRTVYGDPERLKKNYFETYPGYYYTGDGCRIDEDGFHWLQGRIDDVINVSGHRLGTAEIESALVQHSSVAESAVVGCIHDIKGQGIYCYVTTKAGIKGDDKLAKELKDHVRKVIGPIATPDYIQFTDSLPKTRSGKIMRRILRKIAENIYEGFGDTSTLADPTVVDHLVTDHKTLIGEK
jgi:acetyl-CoA synthetase